MVVSPPIRFRIEWADSQGKVTASWLAAHFNFLQHFSFVMMEAIGFVAPAAPSSPMDLGRNYSFAPSGLNQFPPITHGLRRGLYSCAASRLLSRLSSHFRIRA
jgi:cytosine/adenosine deaminase-related metal-dependent hydrolase